MIFSSNKIIFFSFFFLAGNKVGVSSSYSKHICFKHHLMKVIRPEIDL